MDRALLGNLEKLQLLPFAQLPGDLDVQLDPINPPFLGLAFGAVDGMDPRMSKPGSDALERPTFAPGI